MKITSIILEINAMAIWLPLASMVGIVCLGIISYWSFFKKCAPNTAMVRKANGVSKVAFSGLFVMPIFHQLDIIDLREKTLLFEDFETADLSAPFRLEITLSPENTDTELIEIAEKIGGNATFSAEKLKVKLEPLVLMIGNEVLASSKEGENETRQKEQLYSALNGKLNGFTIRKLSLHQLKPPNKADHSEINLSPNTTK